MNNGYLGFPKILIDSLKCQCDYSELTLNSSDSADYVSNGTLVCSQCGLKYTIENKILNLLPRQQAISLTMKSEITARDKQALNYDRRMQKRFYKEVVPTINEIDPKKYEKIIEYGCGTGRITTELLKTGATILAIDFSLDSINVLKNKLSVNDKVGLVVADATQFKTALGFFDKAASFQVYEHIPSQEQRVEFLQNVADTLKSNGIMVNSVYHQDLRRIIKKMPQEGLHKSDIFYHFFSSLEIKYEFGKVFKDNQIKYIDITLPLEARINLPGKFSGFLSRLSSRTFILKNFAHLLLIKSTKK